MGTDAANEGLAAHGTTSGDELPEGAHTLDPSQLPWSKRVVGVLVRPVATFDAIAQRPDLVTPLVGVALSSLVLSSAIAPQLLSTISKTLPPNIGMPATVMPIIRILSIVSGSIGAVLSWLLGSIAIYLFAKLVSGRGTLRAAISSLGFAMFPHMLQNLLVAGQILITHRIPSPQGLAGYWPGLESPIVRTLLINVNVFAIWGAVLTVIAISSVFRLSRTKSVVLMSVFWIMSMAAQVVTAKGA